MESAIRALPPSFVRDTAMFAMLIASVAEQRPDAAYDAGPVVVVEEDHERRELDLDPEAQRTDEPVPPSPPNVVPATSSPPRSPRR